MFLFFSLLSVIFTWILISFGAFVRLHGAGLACPDWPLCYGDLIPPPGFEIALEVGHRFMAVALGIIIIILCILSFANQRYLKMRNLTCISLVVVIFQGILGALTVWMLLNPWIVTSHLLGGNLLLAILVYITCFAWTKNTSNTPTSVSFPTPTIIWIMIILFSIMLFSGGLNSSTYSGYSCNAFPGCLKGSFLPESINEWIHMLHRLIAIGGTIILFFLAGKYWPFKKDKTWKILLILFKLFLISEIFVGIFNAMYLVPRPISGLHTAIAASITVVLSIALFKAIHQKKN